MKKISGAARRAINDYNMIQKGDCIAVGVSGGKDSLTLLAAMTELQRYMPLPFDLKAITVDMGFEGTDITEVSNYCSALGVEHIVCKTNIGRVLFDIRGEKNPCSLCANLRRGNLNSAAAKNGCNKIALGHHFDDAVETFFLSLFYEGRLHCFSPVTYLSRKDVTVIRPLIFVTERQIEGFAQRTGLPAMYNPCPANGNTKRQEVKSLLQTLEGRYPGLRKKAFRAISQSLL